MLNFKGLLLISFTFTYFSFNIIIAQQIDEFTIIKQVKTTAVKDQQQTNTCWSFAPVSFIETEAIRLGKEELDLSEMFFVRYSYVSKSTDYVRFHGNMEYTDGGQAHDVMKVLKLNGVVPKNAYSGKMYDQPYHEHSELTAALKGMLDAVIAKSQDKLTNRWPDAVKAILDVYLGIVPNSFDYKGKSYSSVSFAQNIVGINPEDYIEFTSFTHQPFYKSFPLEVPDNWAHCLYMNLPVDEFMSLIDNALDKGYSVCWDGDVSEETFRFETGTAVLPYEDTNSEKIADFQKERQITFDNWKTTDDHLMHIVGVAKDVKGNKYYYTKNSWGATGKYKGYLFMSEAYVKLKTIAIMIHKDAIPVEIASKLKIK